jgi:hypothetical protein
VGDVWVAVIHAFLAGYLPVAVLATRRAADVNLGQAPRGRRGFWPGRPGALLVAAVVGLGLGLLGPWLTEPHRGLPHQFWIPGDWSPEVYWHRLLGTWIMTWFACWVVVVVRTSNRFARAADALDPLDLFDHTPAEPFVRQGLFQMLAVAGAVAFLGLLGLDEGLTPMLALFGGGGVVLVAVAGLLPLRAARGVRLAARTRELEWCDQRIRASRQAFRAEERNAPGGCLADLLAYREFVRGVNAWPLELTGTRRVVLYLLIPVLSWVGGAIAQELVQALLRR